MGARILLVLAMGACLTSCAPKVFYKSGASQQDFVTDKYSCNKDAHQSAGFGTGLAGALNVQAFFEQCMNAHGWYVQQNG